MSTVAGEAMVVRGTPMPLILVISSYVAASRVGGAIAPYALAPMKIDPVLVPTCLYGRHPGWGPPGGAAVDAKIMEAMLTGIEANGLFPMINAVVTGHFSNPGQVDVAVNAIKRVRDAWPGYKEDMQPPPPLIVVDPIMGDEYRGLYVREDTARAIAERLAPVADLLCPNLWEFARLAGKDLSDLRTPEQVARAAKAAGGDWLISSVPTDAGIGVLHVDGSGALLAETELIAGRVPNGTGDLLTLRFAGERVCGAARSMALSHALGATFAVIEKAVDWRAPELPLAACADILRDPPRTPVSVLQV